MNPIHQDTDGWYFWLETWADRIGPFATYELCNAAFTKYCETELVSRPSE